MVIKEDTAILEVTAHRHKFHMDMTHHHRRMGIQFPHMAPHPRVMAVVRPQLIINRQQITELLQLRMAPHRIVMELLQLRMGLHRVVMDRRQPTTEPHPSQHTLAVAAVGASQTISTKLLDGS